LLQENKCYNASFHKTALAHTLHGSVATQLGLNDRVYSRYVRQSFLIVTVTSK